MNLDAIGKEYKHFEVTKYLPIEELRATLVELVHKPTGATVIHIANDDPENLFCLSFQTLPSSSNGVPHILEHIVLCGSKKYPVKDPFFAMTRRSLHTFMNAMTGADFTCYPASSQVKKDFYNLLEVYLDAVFYPELKQTSFLQEGHRLEFIEPGNPKSSLLYKGVVFNEMKGSMSSVDERVWHELMRNLTPNLPYAHNSGGDPSSIPELTYEELKEFHKTYYHPSHALFFFYGNFPLKEHLDFIEKNALKNAQKTTLLPPIQKQERFHSPLHCEGIYPISKEESTEKKAILSFGWLTATISEQDDVLALCLIDSILMDTDASPLRHALLTSGLCSQANGYIDTEMSEVPWVVIFKGCEAKDAKKIEKLIRDTLQTIIREKIPEHLIRSALHQLEFSRLEITGDYTPFGLTLFFRSALAKQQGCDSENALMVHSLFKKLEKCLADPNYLSNLIKKYFLDNKHFVRLVMEPDPDLETKERETEHLKLKELQNHLSKDKIQEILEQTKKLTAYQEEIENQNLECLPKVTLDDVPKKLKDYPLETTTCDSLTLFHHDCFTNHILYADLVFDLPDLNQENWFYASLFANLLVEMGAKGRNYIKNLEFTQEFTGGIASSIALNVQASNPFHCKPTFSIRGKALYRNSEKLFQLLCDTASAPDFTDKKRIKEVLFKHHSYLEGKVQTSAMRYAAQLSLSGLSPVSDIYNQWHGLPYFENLRKIIQNPDKKIPELLEILQQLQHSLLCTEKPHLIIGCGKKHFDLLQKEKFYNLSNIDLRRCKPWSQKELTTTVESQGKIIAAPVAFTSMAYQTTGYSDPLAPGLLIATNLFEDTILLQKIREKGGAYGAGASYSVNSGNFYFYSYRDPHIAPSIEVFHEAIHRIASGKFNARELEEAKLGILQDIDSPLSPGSRAEVAYSWYRSGKTVEMRENFRNSIIEATEKDVAKAVDQYLAVQKGREIVVSFAGKELLDREFPRGCKISAV